MTKMTDKKKEFKPQTANITNIDEMIINYVKKYDFSPDVRKLANLEVEFTNFLLDKF